MTTVGSPRHGARSGRASAHEGTLRSLGLGRIGKSAEHKESPELAGKLRHVAHLVEWRGRREGQLRQMADELNLHR